MKINTATEAEIDLRLDFGQMKAGNGFCRGYEDESEVPVGFYDLQDEIRDGLERVFFSSFDDGKDRSHLDVWKLSGSHKWFFFPAELINAEEIIIELSTEILSDKLVAVILAYLEKCKCQYCVVVAVYEGEIKGPNYLGRFVVNPEEIAVEDTLAGVWSKRIQLLEIENQ
jgi:hypothetical protein